MMTSGFFALCLMITLTISIVINNEHDFDCAKYGCLSGACFISNTKSNCATGQFEYCDQITIHRWAYYCDDAPTSYYITVTGAIGYYSTWVESGPNDVQMENNKPIYVINGHGFYIWWTGDNTWRLNKEVGDSESISECDESNLVDCPWFDICVIGNGLLSGYYSPQEGEDGFKTLKYYRSDGDYEFKIFYYKSGPKWRLFKYKSGKDIALSRACYSDIIFDCSWVTDDSDLCAA